MPKTTVTNENNNNLDMPVFVLDALNQIKPIASGFHAIMFSMSKLMPFNREPKQIEYALMEAIRIFSPIKGLIFKLKNHNLVCIIQRNTIISIERGISQFKRTLPHDPILVDSHKKDIFCTIYDLGTQWETFFNLVDDIENDPVYSTVKKQTDGTVTQLVSHGISLETVSNIEKILSNTNLLPYLRRQPIYWYNGQEVPRKIANHLFISIQALQESLAISEPIMSNTWLFKYVTTLLDKQTLNFLPELLTQNSIENLHINMNLRSLITSGFYRFFQNYNREKPLSICIDILDYIAHPDVLLYAREMLGQKGCRVILSGINAQHLETITFDNIPASVFKINWSQGILERKNELKALVEKLGAYKIILHRCETEREIQEGIDCNIEQFQGFGIDQILRSQKIE